MDSVVSPPPLPKKRAAGARHPDWRHTVERAFVGAPFVHENGIRLVDCALGWCESSIELTPLGAQTVAGSAFARAASASMAAIVAGRGCWRRNAPRLKRSVLYFWHLVVPMATAVFGDFPGARLRKVGDPPRGVVLQWRRWCSPPRYPVGAEGQTVRQQFESVRLPLVALSISDDELMTGRGPRALVDCYADAPRRIECVAPADVAARRIGHFGFFRDAFESTLWARAVDWLCEFHPAKETT